MTVLLPFQKKSSELKVTSPRPGSAGTNFLDVRNETLRSWSKIRRIVEPVVLWVLWGFHPLDGLSFDISVELKERTLKKFKIVLDKKLAEVVESVQPKDSLIQKLNQDRAWTGSLHDIQFMYVMHACSCYIIFWHIFLCQNPYCSTSISIYLILPTFQLGQKPGPIRVGVRVWATAYRATCVGRENWFAAAACSNPHTGQGICMMWTHETYGHRWWRWRCG